MESLVSDLVAKFCHSVDVLLEHSEELGAVIRLYLGFGVCLCQDFRNSFLKGVVLHSDEVVLFRGQEHLLAQFLLLFSVQVGPCGLLRGIHLFDKWQQ